jgi:hypothetical protein
MKIGNNCCNEKIKIKEFLQSLKKMNVKKVFEKDQFQEV